MKHILIVDDSRAQREVLERHLTRARYQTSQAASAREAMSACLRDKPDLVLLDVHLPDGNGIELCRRIKADPRLSHIPVILLTGEAVDVSLRVDGLEAGADDYVLKPYVAAELLARVETTLAAAG